MEPRSETDQILDGRESIAELVALLGQSSLRVRRAAVAALAKREPSETLPGLLDALGDDENAAARNAAGDVVLRYGEAVVAALTRALDPERCRDRTIQILGLLARIPCRESVEAVLPLAGHADSSIGAAAIGCLAGLKDPAAVPILMNVLDSGDRWQTFYAIDALGEIGHAAAVNRLVPLAADPYYHKAVFRALGRIGDESSIPPLVSALAGGRRPDRTALAALDEMVVRARPEDVREALVERIRDAVVELDVPALTQGLIELAREGDAAIRQPAVRALGWVLDPAAIPCLVGELVEPQVADVAAEALLAMGDEHADEILAAAMTTPLPSEGLRRVIDAVGHVATPRVDEFLAAACRHDEEDIRHAAVTCLTARPGPGHLETLVTALGDHSPGVADQAVDGLLNLAAISPRDREQVAGRVDGLTASKSPEVRRAALRIVGRLGTEGASEALELALHDPDGSVRREATALLGESADPDRLWRLTTALADEDARVREEAVLAIGRLRDERARGVLLSSLHDRSIWVKCRAARALAEHPAVEVQAALEHVAREEVLPVRVSAVEALGYLRPDSEPFLREIVTDREAEVRRAAMRALVTGRGEVPVSVLAVALEDSVWSVRCAAAEALGASGQPAGFSPLSHALDRESDPVVRRNLITALFNVDAESSLPFLVAALAEKDVAQTAAEMLVAGHRVFADELRAEWASGVDPATREGLSVVLQEIGRRESSRSGLDEEGERP
ncbi:MAG: HEAT repeat domain-containing protein [Acidobacteriota bacterium]